MDVFDNQLLEHLVDLYCAKVKQSISVDFALWLFWITDIFSNEYSDEYLKLVSAIFIKFLFFTKW